MSKVNMVRWVASWASPIKLIQTPDLSKLSKLPKPSMFFPNTPRPRLYLTVCFGFAVTIQRHYSPYLSPLSANIREEQAGALGGRDWASVANWPGKFHWLWGGWDLFSSVHKDKKLRAPSEKQTPLIWATASPWFTGWNLRWGFTPSWKSSKRINPNRKYQSTPDAFWRPQGKVP